MTPTRRNFLLGAASVIAASVAPVAAEGLTLDKLRGARRILEANGLPLDLAELRQVIAECIERCLNPPWVIPDGAHLDFRPGGFTDIRCHPMDNTAAWDRLDALYEHYMAMMGGKDAPMTATEAEVLSAKLYRPRA